MLLAYSSWHRRATAVIAWKIVHYWFWHTKYYEIRRFCQSIEFELIVEADNRIIDILWNGISFNDFLKAIRI